jgi:glyoxylase-like metal-dependent hydrolase (beta-lactamase superfamily II)
MGINKWVEEFGIPVYLHEEEKEILAKANLNLSYQFGKNYSYEEVTCFTSGEEAELAGMKFRVIHTPGHTKGGCCYYFESEEVLISGDTLFQQSVGRSDFPTGNMRILVNSIKDKLFCLPDMVMVYPGHGEYTCIADEKEFNLFVR